MNDNGISPVAGVILMVAITVILAAVIAGFVFKLADNINKEEVCRTNITIGATYEEQFIFGTRYMVTDTNGTAYQIYVPDLASKVDRHVWSQIKPCQSYNVTINGFRITQIDGISTCEPEPVCKPIPTCTPIPTPTPIPSCGCK